jgi:hypothetical protein
VAGDRSSALLAELQAVCQRILAGDGRSPGGTAALTTMASVANGTAVANSLEALRRQCVDNHQQVGELKRSVDVHRGVVANDSAGNARMLVDVSRSVEALAALVERDRAERQGQTGDLVRSVESLRVGLAGFSAANRQQLTDLRGSVEALDRTVGAVGEQVQSALNTLGGHIQDALTTLGEQISLALQATRDQVGQEMGRQVTAYEAVVGELHPEHTRERLDELEAMLSVGLPTFSREIQAGVQDTLLQVSRTFRLAEREHGNRMGELHRDFDATVRRLEAALQSRRREEPVRD